MNVSDAVDAVLPSVVDDLAALVAIPSVSALPTHAGYVQQGDAVVEEGKCRCNHILVRFCRKRYKDID